MDSPSEDDSLPSPGADLEREERVMLSGGEEEAPPCPEEEELDDEWANDDDAGYLLEPITEEEFLEIEEVRRCVPLNHPAALTLSLCLL